VIFDSLQPRILLSPPHMSGTEIDYINEAFRTNWIAPLGPNVDLFEKEIANYVGAKDAVAVNSGTAAIHLALSLLGVTNNDTVFCSTLTFVASANPILYQGAKPVFIDSEPDTWNMSPQALRLALDEARLIGELPKAVIIVHIYGQPAKMKELNEICKEYGVPVIEDAAESLGSTINGRATGTMGDFGVYSFNGNKIITASSGGMLISNNYEAIRKARFLASQSKDPVPYYQHSEIGYNYRMSNILAGVGRSQLKVLEERVKARRGIFELYSTLLGTIPGITFLKEMDNNVYSNRWLTVATIDKDITGITPAELMDILEKNNIEARRVWKPLHLQPLFDMCKYYPHDKGIHVAEQLFKSGICLPSGSNLSVTEQLRVIETTEKAIRGKQKKTFSMNSKEGT